MFIVLTATYLHFAVRPGIDRMFGARSPHGPPSGIESFSTEGFALA
jgi:hypothetical protein